MEPRWKGGVDHGGGDPGCARSSGQVVNRAVASQPDMPEAAERAERFRQKYRHKLETLRHQPL